MIFVVICQFRVKMSDFFSKKSTFISGFNFGQPKIEYFVKNAYFWSKITKNSFFSGENLSKLVQNANKYYWSSDFERIFGHKKANFRKKTYLLVWVINCSNTAIIVNIVKFSPRFSRKFWTALSNHTVAAFWPHGYNHLPVIDNFSKIQSKMVSFRFLSKMLNFRVKFEIFIEWKVGFMIGLSLIISFLSYQGAFFLREHVIQS